jgi:hypothetical protein
LLLIPSPPTAGIIACPAGGDKKGKSALYRFHKPSFKQASGLVQIHFTFFQYNVIAEGSEVKTNAQACADSAF